MSVRNIFETTTNITPTIIVPEVKTPQIILPNQRQSTFANLGTDVSMARSLDEALYLSGLDYIVEPHDTFIQKGNEKIQLPTKALIRNTDGHFYANVSQSYCIAQNRDIFDVLNSIFHEITIKKMGETSDGMVYAIAAVEPIKILGDTIEPDICIQSSHNGKYGLMAAFCLLRLICQNQFSMAFKESPNTIRARHMDKSIDRFDEKMDLLLLISKYIEVFRKNVEKYAETKLTSQQIEKIINECFPIDIDNMKDYQIERAEEQRNLLINAYNADDNQNFKNSLWGIINAFADFVTHAPNYRKTDTIQETNFKKVTFDPRVIQHYIDIALRIAA